MMQARITPAQIESIERRPVTHTERVSEADGSDGSCVQCDTYWPALHETPTWWLKTKGFSPRGKLLRIIKVTRRCLRALDMEEALFLYQAWCRELLIAACHPLVTRFLRGALRLRPPVRSRVPPWDLAVVLEALCRPSFEPFEEISDRHLTLKTVFLLATSSLKTVGDLQELYGHY